VRGLKPAVLSAIAAMTAVALVGCGASDSTVAKTPEPTTTTTTVAPTSATPAPPSVSTPRPPPTSPSAIAYDPCATNLAAPEIAQAVAGLPPDPRSGQGWSPEPLAGNYNECAQLSVVIIKANTNAEYANTRAIMFHQGKFIPTGVPDTFGFNGIDTSVSTGDTVALKFSNSVPGLDSIVRFRWNGNNVELVANTR
jgi:hypothetical protein